MLDDVGTDTITTSLFSPTSFGEIELANRIVMAPMTRLRSGPDGVPGELLVEHYRQRASLGMIITEGTFPSRRPRSRRSRRCCRPRSSMRWPWAAS